MHIRNPRIRRLLAEGLQKAVESQPHIIAMVSSDSLSIIVKLNKLKRGLADLELDCDTTIQTLQVILDQNFDDRTLLEISALTYNILFLVNHDEFSVREYSLYAFKKVLDSLEQKKESVKGLLSQMEQ